MSITSRRNSISTGHAGWAATMLCAALVATSPASALSEIPEEDVPADNTITTVPLPAPLPNAANPAPAGAAPATPAPAEDAEPPSEAPEEGIEPQATEPAEPVPPIQYDLTLLPEPVRSLREKIIAACKAGDLEALRPLLAGGDDATVLSLGGASDDPIRFLKELSGDGEGHEILAILEEVLEAGYVHMDPGSDEELYVWPYFFAVPLQSLTPPQRVELFRLVTAGDYEEMKNYGGYIFYRVGITPEGKWAFFVAGD